MGASTAAGPSGFGLDLLDLISLLISLEIEGLLVEVGCLVGLGGSGGRLLGLAATATAAAATATALLVGVEQTGRLLVADQLGRGLDIERLGLGNCLGLLGRPAQGGRCLGVERRRLGAGSLATGHVAGFAGSVVGRGPFTVAFPGRLALDGSFTITVAVASSGSGSLAIAFPFATWLGSGGLGGLEARLNDRLAVPFPIARPAGRAVAATSADGFATATARGSGLAEVVGFGRRVALDLGLDLGLESGREAGGRLSRRLGGSGLA